MGFKEQCQRQPHQQIFFDSNKCIRAPLKASLQHGLSLSQTFSKSKGQGVFCRPKYMELDYHIKLANAGLLYSDEEISDSENEEEPDTTACMPLRKIKYKKCDPCKPKKVEKEPEVEQPPKDLVEEVMRKGEKPKFKKIPSGCQCDYYGEHGTHPSVWDNPFDDRMDMLRQHEMNK